MTNLNSISSYNKLFDQNLKQFDQSMGQAENQFDNIMQQQTMAMNSRPPMVNGGIELNVGLENMGITPVEGSTPAKNVKSSSPIEQTASDFGKAFGDGLNSVNNSQIEMENAVETMASGGDISAHEVMIAAEKASLSMNMAIQMRNKIIAAYNEINNVRI